MNSAEALTAEVGGDALDARDLSIEYGRGRRRRRVVKDVSITVSTGETVALVGESGSGKTSVAMACLGLVPIAEGTVSINGTRMKPGVAGAAVKAGAQAVFQSPYSSLDPAQSIGDILLEPLQGSGRTRTEAVMRAKEVLDEVGIDPAALGRYPREFSGGQRQRISIARAMMARPRLIVCDEPTSALDLSIQAQVVNLLLDLQERHGMSFLVISHDLALMRHLATRMYVMQRGQIVEQGDAEDVYCRPQHPYTQRLIGAAPVPDPIVQRQRRASREASAVATS